MPIDNPHELFDVCDADDNVIDQQPRHVVHARGLMHRAVSILVFNSRGELLLHRRSASKDEYPSRYTASASGHVTAGDTYDATAERELEEELGLRAPIQFLAKFPASPDSANEHTHLYVAHTDDPPVPDPDEIDYVTFRSLAEIAVMIERDPQEFTPPFQLLFAWYCENYSMR